MIDQLCRGLINVDDDVPIEQHRRLNEGDGVLLRQHLRGDDAQLLALKRGVEDEFFSRELGVKRDDRLDRCAGEIDLDGGVIPDGHIAPGLGRLLGLGRISSAQNEERQQHCKSQASGQMVGGRCHKIFKSLEIILNADIEARF